MAAGPHAEIVCEYFQHLRMLLVEGFEIGDLKVKNLGRVTAKELYVGYTSTFPPPKVVYKYDVDWGLVWSRLNSPVLEAGGKEALFLVVHNIVPNRERLFDKMNMVASPNCKICETRENNMHLFTECVSVRRKLLTFLPVECSRTSNFEFISLMFSKDTMEDEAVWLIGTFLHYAWIEKILKKRTLRLDKFIGHARLCYRANQVAKKPLLGYIMNIS